MFRERKTPLEYEESLHWIKAISIRFCIWKYGYEYLCHKSLESLQIVQFSPFTQPSGKLHKKPIMCQAHYYSCVCWMHEKKLLGRFLKAPLSTSYFRFPSHSLSFNTLSHCALYSTLNTFSLLSSMKSFLSHRISVYRK